MRTALIALTLLATPALASDQAPLSCQALSAAAEDWEHARQALEEAKYVAFSEEYAVELAIADADERDAMFAARDEAKTQVAALRKDKREAKKAHKALARAATQSGLVCTAG